ncbi:hypothetical protein N7528_002933 [Penicillium herquei]|nr:hypothetical protein N7528_002933 [Penicillium herquei]
MAVPTSSTEARRDDVHIFSEFADEERQDYIQRILAIDHNSRSFVQIPRGNLFHLWFADKEILRQMAHLENGWSSEHINLLLFYTPYALGDPVEILTKGMLNSGSGAERVTKVDDRNQAENALMRDGNQCVLTKHGEPGVDVAYIVPFGLHKTPNTEFYFWDTLETLWGSKAQVWQKAVVRADGCFDTESTSNMISLNRLVREYWDNCQCAFRPVRVSDDQLSMDIAFHWLPLQTGRKDDMVRIDQNPYGDVAEQSISRSPGQNLLLFDYEAERVIHSGEIFTISTTDPDERPLPSKDLLELLWLLKRIAAMQGAERPEADDEDLETHMYSCDYYSDDEDLESHTYSESVDKDLETYVIV